jgi:parallel beta-helix repeat protein
MRSDPTFDGARREIGPFLAGKRLRESARRLLAGRTAVTMGVVLVLAGWAAPASATPGRSPHASVFVSAGQSIQAAIDAAAPGSTIRVAPGTYRENLLIPKNGIQLVGAAGLTVLEPPASPNAVCGYDPSDPSTAGFVQGICIANLNTSDPNNPVPISTVTGVRVSGFSIEGFPNDGILTAFAADTALANNLVVASSGFGIQDWFTTGTVVDGNTIQAGATFETAGISSNNSSGARILNNTVSGNLDSTQGSGSDEAGILVSDETGADTLVEGNHSFDNHYGITIRDASGGTVTQNRVDGNCDGLFVGMSPLGPQEGVITENWTISDNLVTGNSRYCPPEEIAPLPGFNFPAVSGAGIILIGTQAIDVDGNLSMGNSGTTASGWPGGIAVLSTSAFGDPGFVNPPYNVSVEDNLAYGNVPDLSWDGSGKGIQFSNNACATSSPSGLCRPSGH